MVGLLAALVVGAAPVTVVEQVGPTVLAAKKKKKKKPKGAGGKASDKDDDDDEQETSEGLDLTEPTPQPQPEPGPSSGEPVAPTETPEPAKGDAAGWSLVTPRTVGEGANVLEGGVGWPGVYAGFTRGLLKNLDVGARVGFNWGWEGVVTRITPGLRIQLVGKYLLTEIAGLPLGVSFAPGFIVYFLPGQARPGVLLPIAATLGLPSFMNKLQLAVTLEVPFWVSFGSGGAFAVVPIMAGANAEYAITDSLLAFARLKPLGLAVFTSGGVFYAFEALVGVGFHL
jgi:hypothetical protein